VSRPHASTVQADLTASIYSKANQHEWGRTLKLSAYKFIGSECKIAGVRTSSLAAAADAAVSIKFSFFNLFSTSSVFIYPMILTFAKVKVSKM
jgi:hypothetical protein